MGFREKFGLVWALLAEDEDEDELELETGVGRQRSPDFSNGRIEGSISGRW